MKIRHGFVSNSSSSSYIVKIFGLDIEGFVGYLMADYGWEFSVESVRKKIEDDIEKCMASLKEDDENNAEKFIGVIGLLKRVMEERIAFLQELKKTVEDKQDSVSSVNAMLKLHAIELKQTECCVELRCFTSMHNSFNEGMSDLLKEIVLFFIFDHKMKVICERESDNM